MILPYEVDRVVEDVRATRQELAELRRQMRDAREEAVLRRARAQRSLGTLQASMQALRITLVEIPDPRQVLEWRPVNGALDSVLCPLD
jgi:hypothetical protein